MRTPKLLLITAIAALCVPATASADFLHVVAPGESLSSVAAADGLSLSQLAAANGLSTDATLIAGGSLQIPPQTGAVGAPPSGSPSSSSASGSDDSSAATVTAASTAPTSGGYLVAPGDTLSAIALRYGTSIDALASTNGLDPAGILPAGATISVSGAPVSTASSSAPVSTAASSAPVASSSGGTAGSGGAQPTPESVSSGTVGSIAAQNGVSPSLAEAIGYQESGFNNNLVSSTGATGVMQIEPSTWSYIGQTLASPPPLSPISATDNVRGGVLLLRSLLDQTGGDPAMAAAGYYQGLQSVRQNGLYSDTQQYVNNVMALRQRFGGG